MRQTTGRHEDDVRPASIPGRPPLRILHLLRTARPEWTGIGRIVAEIGKGLRAQPYEFHAWFLEGNGPLESMLQEAGFRTKVVGWNGTLGHPAGMVRFWGMVRRARCSLVHLHVGGRLLGALTRSSAGVPLILHAHSRVLESRGAEPTLIRSNYFDVVIGVSQAVCDLVRPARAVRVYPGLAPLLCPASVLAQNERLIIGSAGRLVRLKGTAYLLHALQLLQGQFPEVVLEVAGGGPEYTNLRAESARLGLSEKVTFLDWLPDLQTRIQSWSVFVHPSLEDSFPIVVLEAMRAGLPVVASAVGGIPEIVEEGITGFLVPPRDPAALAERLGMLLRDAELRRRMAAAAQQRVSEVFCASRMVSEIAGIYQKLWAAADSGQSPGSGLEQVWL